MIGLFHTLTDLADNPSLVRRRRYGVIETVNGRLLRIRFRPWPKLASLLEVHWTERRKRSAPRRDVCRLYFNQPRGHARFLSLTYVVTGRGTSLATLRAALDVLDEVARIKGSDAILCQAVNPRISDRLMRRWGWQQQLLESSPRHYIKRFYGVYPTPRAAVAGKREDRRASQTTGERAEAEKIGAAIG